VGRLVLTFSQSSFAALLLGLALLAALRWSVRVTLVAVVVRSRSAAATRRSAGTAAHLAELVVEGELDDERALRPDQGRPQAVRQAADLRLGLGVLSRVYRQRAQGVDPRATSASHTIPIPSPRSRASPGSSPTCDPRDAFLLLFRRTRGDPLRGRCDAVRGARPAHDDLRRLLETR